MEVNEAVLKDVFKQGRLSPEPIPTPEGGVAVVVPEGCRLEQLKPHDPPLLRIQQHVTMHDAESFVAYIKRFKGETTRIFAEPGFLSTDNRARMAAIIDYHEAKDAKHKGHSATYTPRYSEQWKRWHAVCQKPLTQTEFAELIEEARADIQEPNAANLMDIVRTFKANKKVDYDSVVYQPDSGVVLNYSEKVEQKGASGILPEKMALGIPVYFRDVAYKVPVFIRFRVGNGGVTFQLKLDRADIIEDEAFNTLVSSVSDRAEVEAYLGRAA